MHDQHYATFLNMIVPAGLEQVPIVRGLFQEYESSLGVDLCFQNFAQELAELPGEYVPPHGCLLLARRGEEAVGCVALRRLDEKRCEMKRLYVKQAAQGTGLGLALVQAVIAEARRIGYQSMLLDTLPSMARAIAIYRRLGFHEVAPYRYNPVPGSLYMEFALSAYREQR